MDKFTIPLSHFRRRFPGPPQLSLMGHIPHKKERVLRPFHTVNFSLILRGSGEYRYNGHTHRITAPAVLSQWPGPTMDYHPDDDWFEVFLIYPPETETAWRANCLLDPERRPVWHLTESGRFRTRLNDLIHLVKHADTTPIDRIDRCAEDVILESRLAAAAPRHTGAAAAIARIRTIIENDPLTDHDLDALVAAEGLSNTHFRRLWQRQVGTPPARHLAELRMRHAARELVASDVQISSIARQTGFADPLHFSRRFRQFSGASPSEFRARHRPPELG